MRKAPIAVIAAGTLVAGSAQAAHIDFVDYAATNGEQGVADGFTDNFDGVNITFSSTDGDPNQFFVYFDDLFDGRPGGLGTCDVMEAGPGTECADTSQDNIRSVTSVMLEFDAPQSLFGLSFTDMDHFSLNDNDTNTLLIGVNGGALTSMTFADAVAASFVNVSNITFGFGGDNPTQYYVNSLETPLPAAAPLLLAGLGGLGLLARRRKRPA